MNYSNYNKNYMIKVGKTLNLQLLQMKIKNLVLYKNRKAVNYKRMKVVSYP